RPGGISKEQIEKVVGNVHLHHDSENVKQIRSPGMKYKHYSPNVPLWLVKGTPEKIQRVIDQEQLKSKKVGVLASTKTLHSIQADQKIDLGMNPSDIAANLYDGLRSFQKNDIDLIICETFPEQGIGQAIMNRLTKAADKVL